jgi:hypothetical protein
VGSHAFSLRSPDAAFPAFAGILPMTCRGFPPGMGVECGDAAARDSSAHIVGPARQNDGHPRAEHDAGGLSLGEKALLFDDGMALRLRVSSGTLEVQDRV